MKRSTFIMIKPDAVKRGLVGDIISRFEKIGELGLIEFKMMTRREAKKFYGEHTAKPFFEELISFMTSGPVVGFILHGRNIIERVRKTIGATDPVEAAPGTIRADFGIGNRIMENVVHASANCVDVTREANLFFGE